MIFAFSRLFQNFGVKIKTITNFQQQKDTKQAKLINNAE